jgi:hypothetical protein
VIHNMESSTKEIHRFNNNNNTIIIWLIIMNLRSKILFCKITIHIILTIISHNLLNGINKKSDDFNMFKIILLFI